MAFLVTATFLACTAVIIVDTLDALLLGSRASGCIASLVAMMVVQAFYASLFRNRAGRGVTTTVGIGFTFIPRKVDGGSRLHAHVGFRVAIRSVSSFRTPVRVWAVVVVEAFHAASGVQVTERIAFIVALVIFGTEVGANVGDGIAVNLSRDFTTITISASLTGSSAIVAAAVGTAVRGDGRAIGVNGAVYASSIEGVALRLVGGSSSVLAVAIGVGCASQASSVSLAVVLAGVSLATSVIFLGVASVRIHANSSVGSGSADGVTSLARRTIVTNAIGITGASSAMSVLHAVLVGSTIVVVSARRHAKLAGGVANGITVDISLPGGGGGTIGIAVAVEANSGLHAILSLSTGAIAVLSTGVDALSGS